MYHYTMAPSEELKFIPGSMSYIANKPTLKNIETNIQIKQNYTAIDNDK